MTGCVGQAVMREQVCLLAGTGGIGCATGLALGRMGVRKVIFLDMDVVDVSNLNRYVSHSLVESGLEDCR